MTQPVGLAAFDLTGKTALVTGAGGLLGREHVAALAEIGATVILTDLDLAAAQAAAASLRGTHGDRVVAAALDVTSEDSIRAVLEAQGPIDVLVNNAAVDPKVTAAGGPELSRLEHFPLESWDFQIAVGLTGAFLCTQQAFRVMKEQTPRGGRIINNGSISAHVPRANSAPYTASKHAITGLTKSTSLDGRQYDIACGQIDIGNALTELAVRNQNTEPTMDVEHVANAVLQMAKLPPGANVQFMTILATKMPYIGRG